MTGSLTVVGPVNASSFTGSLLGTASTASFVTTAQTASYVLQAVSSSFASTSPYSGLQGTVPTWNQNTTGTAATASFVTGSNVIGNISGNATTATTASYITTAQTASYVLNAVSASYATTAGSTSAVAGLTTNYVTKATSASTLGNSNLINDAAGNLGLGVTPSAWTSGKVLQTVGGSLWGLDVNTLGLVQNAFLNGASYNYISSAAASYYIQALGQHIWYNAASGTAGTSITFTQAMTLDASGNLMVGTTNSGYGKLGVYSASNTLIGIANSTSYAQLQQNSADLYINTNLSGAAGGNLIFRFGSGSTEYMRIASSSNVLIGTTTDSGYKLDVNGTFRASGTATFSSSVTAGTFVSNDATYGAITFNGGTSNGVVGSFGTQLRMINFTASGSTLIQGNGAVDINTQGGYNLTFGTTAIERMRITSAGNVGIGTTSPGAKLTVSGTSPEVQINNGDTNTLVLGGFSGGRHFIKSINLGVALTPLTLQASAFTFDTGNVGIGTITPNAKLDVNGNTIVTGSLTVTSTITELSSLRYKEDIQPISFGLDKVIQMRGVSYIKKDTQLKEIGVIAEEVNKILPDLVHKSSDGQVESVSYSRITAVLIEAIKELKAEIDILKNK